MRNPKYKRDFNNMVPVFLPLGAAMHLTYQHEFIGGEYSMQEECKYWVNRGFVVLADTVEPYKYNVDWYKKMARLKSELATRLAEKRGSDE